MTDQELQTKNMQLHEQRVINEKNELADRTVKLAAFISASPTFTSLPTAEKSRLKRQLNCMIEYVEVLDERIAAFESLNPHNTINS